MPTFTEEPSDPRELCLVCKRPEERGRSGTSWSGQGENKMIVGFYLHADCRPVLENRRGGRPG